MDIFLSRLINGVEDFKANPSRETAYSVKCRLETARRAGHGTEAEEKALIATLEKYGYTKLLSNRPHASPDAKLLQAIFGVK